MDHSVSNKNRQLPLKFIHGLLVFTAKKIKFGGRHNITCYTSCQMNLENRSVIFHATSNYGDDGKWRNWCLVEWIDQNEEHNTYPGKILGFFKMDDLVHAVIQLSSDPITIEQLTDEFVCNFFLEQDQPIELVEIETISSTLCVFKNYGGPLNSYICVLPKRKWGHYFGQKSILMEMFTDELHTRILILPYLPSCVLLPQWDMIQFLMDHFSLCPSNNGLVLPRYSYKH
jgi:hypothetical protein